MYPVIFFLDSYGVYLSRIFLEFVLKAVNPTMVSRPEIVLWQECFPGNSLLCLSPSIQHFFDTNTPRILSGALENFEFYGVKVTGRYIYELKKLIPPSRKEVTHFTWAAFSESCFSPSKKKGLWSWKNEQN